VALPPGCPASLCRAAGAAACPWVSEADVFGRKPAGEDPQAMIEKLAGRVKLLHLKDFAEDGKMTDVGSGTLDFPALIAAGRAAGVEHMFVEHDFPPKPYWPSVEASVGYLRALA